jgi:hypothetical protein
MVRQFRTIEDMENFYYGGLNADMIKKTDDFSISADTAIWVRVVGAKVWSQINYEANTFAGLPKEPWIKSNWRLETSAGHSFPSGALPEGSANAFTSISEAIHPTLANITTVPRLVDHAWGATWLQMALADAGADDTIGATYLARQCGDSHIRAISAALCQDVDTPALTSMESIDRVSSSSAETAHTSAPADGDIYTLNRDGSTAYDAQVSSSGSAAGNLRDLTVNLVDSVWASITSAGGGLGDGYVIFTRYNTIKEWSALLEAERRFNVLGEATFIPRAGEASAVTPGLEVGFNVATYFGIPIIPCKDYDSSRAAVRTNEVGPINFINTKYNRVAMLQPTVYTQSNWPEDTIRIGTHGTEGHYYTIGELRCYNFVVNGKVTDIK